jgi:hypothetical protein
MIPQCIDYVPHAWRLDAVTGTSGDNLNDVVDGGR